MCISTVRIQRREEETHPMRRTSLEQVLQNYKKDTHIAVNMCVSKCYDKSKFV